MEHVTKEQWLKLALYNAEHRLRELSQPKAKMRWEAKIKEIRGELVELEKEQKNSKKEEFRDLWVSEIHLTRKNLMELARNLKEKLEILEAILRSIDRLE